METCNHWVTSLLLNMVSVLITEVYMKENEQQNKKFSFWRYVYNHFGYNFSRVRRVFTTLSNIKIELFVKTDSSWKSPTIFTKSYIWVAWQGSEYASVSITSINSNRYTFLGGSVVHLHVFLNKILEKLTWTNSCPSCKVNDIMNINMKAAILNK